MTSPHSVSFEIADRLRREILIGQYRIGERMPSERDLAARFDVSRGAVREALSQLEQQGVIEIQPGGVRVKALEDASLAILGPMLALEEVPNPQLVDQFLEIFSMLTSLTVKGAIEQASGEQMIQLREMLVSIGGKAENFEQMQPAWQAMLDYMARIDNNLVVRLIGNDVKAQVVGQMLELDIKPELPAGAGQDLVSALSEAFQKQDGQMAAQAFEKHFDQLRAAMQDALIRLKDVYRRQAV
ncbi:MAG: GntR family transcriptional regulator [Gammaproteobacteria bacterium]|nr:GntR family transcriptional regulator [Gammaproteobacteria bacterium]